MRIWEKGGAKSNIHQEIDRMGEELNKLKELWRTKQITDAQFVEMSQALAQVY